MFKVLVLQTLYTLSDEAAEYQVRDRLSFMRFVSLALPSADASGRRPAVNLARPLARSP